jgi:hypothetical protein
MLTEENKFLPISEIKGTLGINLISLTGKNEVGLISSSLGKAKNYHYQHYFVPYKICIVSFYSKPPYFITSIESC